MSKFSRPHELDPSEFIPEQFDPQPVAYDADEGEKYYRNRLDGKTYTGSEVRAIWLEERTAGRSVEGVKRVSTGWEENGKWYLTTPPPRRSSFPVARPPPYSETDPRPSNPADPFAPYLAPPESSRPGLRERAASKVEVVASGIGKFLAETVEERAAQQKRFARTRPRRRTYLETTKEKAEYLESR